MNSGHIRVAELDMLRVTSCTYEKKINDYGQAEIKGYVDDGAYDMFKAEVANGGHFVIEEGQDFDVTIVFSGILKNTSFVHDKGFWHVKLVMQGSMAKLDRTIHTRIFQNGVNPFSEIMSVVKKENDTLYRVRDFYNTDIPHMVVQYEETDWEFLKRIICEAGGCLIPDYKDSGCRFFVGVNLNAENRINTENYTLNSLFHEYEKKKANGIEQSLDADWEYVLKENLALELGDSVYLNGHCLYVYRVEGKWEGEELIHYFTLRKKSAFASLKQKNMNLCGATFAATVTDVEHDKIEVTFDTVEAYGSRQYQYATVYSSANGAGWYCMPEFDDAVTITFATQEEESAYASGAVHLTMGDKDADTKFIRNPYDKEIRFTKDALTITNNNGTEIILSDADGLTLASAGAITIQAEDMIIINSLKEKITLQGEGGVELTQGSSKVIVNGDVLLLGDQVHVQNLE